MALGDIADRVDVWDVGAHLRVHGDKATLVHRYAGGVGADLPAVGSPAHGNQDHVVELRLGRGILTFERHPQSFLHGFDLGGPGLQHHVVEAARVGTSAIL